MLRQSALVMALVFVANAAEARPHIYSIYELRKDLQDIKNTMMRYCGTNAHKIPRLMELGHERACGQAFKGISKDGVAFNYDFIYLPHANGESHSWGFNVDLGRYRYEVTLHTVTTYADRTQSTSTATTAQHVYVYRFDNVRAANGLQAHELLTNGDAWRGKKAGKDRKDIYDGPAHTDYSGGLQQLFKQIARFKFALKETYRIE